MNPYDHLGPSQLAIYNQLTTLDDVQTDGQAHQTTQPSDTSTQPPGAGIIRPTTLDHSRLAENLFLQPTAAQYHDYSSPEPSPLSFYSQSDGSEVSLSAPSTSHSISPVPRASHVFRTRPSFPRHRQRYLSTSHSSPGTQNDQPLGSPFAYSGTSSQQWGPPTIQGGGGSSPPADPYAGVLQSTLMVAGEFETAQILPFPVPTVSASFTPSNPQYQVRVPELEPGPSSLERRSSEIGNVFDAQNAQQLDFRTQYPSENQLPTLNALTPNDEWSGSSLTTSDPQHPPAESVYVNMIHGAHTRGSVTSLNHADASGLQDNFYSNYPIVAGPASSGAPPQIGAHNLSQQGSSPITPEAPGKKRRTGERHCPASENQPTPSAYPSYPGWSRSSQPMSRAQYPAPGPSYMVPGPSSDTNRDSVTSLPIVDSISSLSSSGLESMCGNDDHSALFPESASNGDPFPIGGNSHSQQGTLSAVSGASRRTVRRTGKRKRDDNPKDMKAAERLRDQRQIDADNLEELRKILVPDNVGPVQKKDLTGLLVYYAKQHQDTCAGPGEDLTTLEHGENYTSLSTSSSQQGRLTHSESPQASRIDTTMKEMSRKSRA